MKGSIRQRSPGSWELRYDGRPRDDGRRWQTTETVRGSREVAQRVLQERLAKVDPRAIRCPRGCRTELYLDRYGDLFCPSCAHTEYLATENALLKALQEQVGTRKRSNWDRWLDRYDVAVRAVVTEVGVTKTSLAFGIPLPTLYAWSTKKGLVLPVIASEKKNGRRPHALLQPTHPLPPSQGVDHSATEHSALLYVQELTAKAIRAGANSSVINRIQQVTSLALDSDAPSQPTEELPSQQRDDIDTPQGRAPEGARQPRQAAT